MLPCAVMSVEEEARIPSLLWLWRRLASTAPIRPLAQEPPYAALKGQKTKKKIKEMKKEKLQLTEIQRIIRETLNNYMPTNLTT